MEKVESWFPKMTTLKEEEEEVWVENQGECIKLERIRQI